MEEEKQKDFETLVLNSIKNNALNLEKFRKELNKRLLADNPDAKEIKKSALSFYIHMDRKMDEALLPYFAEILSLDTKELQTVYQSSIFNKKLKINIPDLPQDISDEKTDSDDDPVEIELKQKIQKDIGLYLSKGLEQPVHSFTVNEYLPEQFHLDDKKPKKLSELQISLILKASVYQIRNYKEGKSEIPQKHCEVFSSIFSLDIDKLMGFHLDDFHFISKKLSYLLQNYIEPQNISDQEKQRLNRFKSEIDNYSSGEPVKIPELILQKACYLFNKTYNELLSYNFGKPNEESASFSRFTILNKLGMGFEGLTDIEENFIKFYTALSLAKTYEFANCQTEEEKLFVSNLQKQNKEEIIKTLPGLFKSLISGSKELECMKDTTLLNNEEIKNLLQSL